jgi:hypothetical protein
MGLLDCDVGLFTVFVYITVGLHAQCPYYCRSACTVPLLLSVWIGVQYVSDFLKHNKRSAVWLLSGQYVDSKTGSCQ